MPGKDTWIFTLFGLTFNGLGLTYLLYTFDRARKLRNTKKDKLLLEHGIDLDEDMDGDYCCQGARCCGNGKDCCFPGDNMCGPKNYIRLLMTISLSVHIMTIIFMFGTDGQQPGVFIEGDKTLEKIVYFTFFIGTDALSCYSIIFILEQIIGRLNEMRVLDFSQRIRGTNIILI